MSYSRNTSRRSRRRRSRRMRSLIPMRQRLGFRR